MTCGYPWLQNMGHRVRRCSGLCTAYTSPSSAGMPAIPVYCSGSDTPVPAVQLPPAHISLPAPPPNRSMLAKRQENRQREKAAKAAKKAEAKERKAAELATMTDEQKKAMREEKQVGWGRVKWRRLCGVG